MQTLKQYFLFPTITVITVELLLSFYGCTKNPGNQGKELVLFYDVPLECGAAPDLGCGSRAKPVFLEMEQYKNIKEAWLNRQGTVIAVIGGPSTSDWKQLNEIIKPIFTKYDVSATYVENLKRQNEFMSDFRTDGKWYKGVDVDKLSLEEAIRLAESAVTFAKNAKLIDEPEAQAIRSDVESYMKQDLVKVRTYDELCASEESRYDAVYNIYQKHIGKERAEKVRKIYEEHQPEEHAE